jgi:predicted dehydrogenase
MTAAGVGAGLGFPQLVTRPAFGAAGTEGIRVGIIAVGGQGRSHMLISMDNVVALCDVDKGRLATAQEQVQKTTRRSCAIYHDYRSLLDSKEVDAVIIATPDHWHALPTIHACQAGKDVYCEKPLTLTIAEGRAMVKAARKYNRIVQTGSQQRSEENFRYACELVRSGRIGKIHTVRVGIPGVNFKGPAVPDSQPPPELDYDFWLGPAPWRPYNVNRVHYNFRFFWDYSGGQMTNWGAHHLDIAQWALGMDGSGPVEIDGKARYHKDGWYEVPQWSEITYKYANGVTVICGMDQKIGTTFEGETGTVYVNRGKLESTPAGIIEKPITERDVQLYKSTNHHKNWYECIKTRRYPICDVEIGHRTATVCHLGNLSLRLGRKIRWDPEKEKILGDTEAAKRLHYDYRSPWRLKV